MKPVYIGFTECEDLHCCYLVAAAQFPWVLHNMEEVLLKRCAIQEGSTTIICQNQRIWKQMMKLLERVLSDEVGNQDRMAQRSLVLYKWYGHGKTSGTHAVDLPETQIFIADGKTFNIQFQGDVVEISQGKESISCRLQPVVPQATDTVQLSKLFQVGQMGRQHSWKVRLGSNTLLVNPMKYEQSLQRTKIVISSARLKTVCNLLLFATAASSAVSIITTKLVYDEVIDRLKCLMMDTRTELLHLLFPLEAIAEHEFQSAFENAKIRVSYVAGLLPTLSIQIFSHERSVMLLGEWFHNPKEFYFAWKQKRLQERRYYELVNPQLRDTLCLLDSTMMSEDSIKGLSKQQNTELFSSEIQQPKAYTVIDKKLKEEMSWIERLKIVSDVVLFRGLLGLEQLTDLVEDSENETFKAGQLIFRKGMKVEKVYVICSGLVELMHDSDTPARQLGPSSLLCWDLLFADTKIASYSAVCTTDTMALSIRRDMCQFIVRSNHLRRIEQISSLAIQQSLQQLRNNLVADMDREMLRRMLLECESVKLEAGAQLRNTGIGWYIVLQSSVLQETSAQSKREYSPGELLAIPQVVSQLTIKSTLTGINQGAQLLQLDQPWLQSILVCHCKRMIQALDKALR